MLVKELKVCQKNKTSKQTSLQSTDKFHLKKKQNMGRMFKGGVAHNKSEYISSWRWEYLREPMKTGQNSKRKNHGKREGVLEACNLKRVRYDWRTV